MENQARPYALTTPRRVTVPLMKAMEEELARMEVLGVIARVKEPSEWCTRMEIMPKKNGSVQICVDLTKLNQSITRERHLLPAVDQTLVQLADAKVFPKRMQTLDFDRHHSRMVRHF